MSRWRSLQDAQVLAGSPLSAAPEQLTPQLGDAWQQALRQHHDHDHECDADDQLPVKRQTTGQIRTGDIDQDRSQHGTDEGAAPAQCNPDQ